jgi:hypothetical protein
MGRTAATSWPKPTDANTIGVVLSTTRLTVHWGSPATITATLSKPPAAAVKVTVVRTQGGDGGVAIAPGGLRFTESNWETPQTVTVTASEAEGAAKSSAHFTFMVGGQPTILEVTSVAGGRGFDDWH